MIKGILFDMDGVLVDTEHLHCKSYIEALKKHNIKLTEQEYFLEWTRKGKGIMDFLDNKNLKADGIEIRKIKRSVYHKLLRKHLRPMPGIKNLLDKIHKKYKTALVSSSYKIDIDIILNLTKLRCYFDAIISKDDVKKIKPGPEPFLSAAKKLKLNPPECVVIEDAEKGVLAARNAGMKIIAVPNIYTKDNDFSNADIILGSISKITPEIIERM